MPRPRTRCAAPGATRRAIYRRLAILSTFGLQHLPFAYIQPALAADKQPLDDLLFLCWCRANEPGEERIESRRLATFLKEFYAAHPRSDPAHLRRMTEQLEKMRWIEAKPLDLPARYDETLGTAKSVVVRMTFFAHFVRDLGEKAQKRADPGDDWDEIPLGRLEPNANEGAADALQRLSDALKLFHSDITIPYASASRLPIILQCEEFHEDDGTATDGYPPPSVRIAFPETLSTEWEGAPRDVSFTAAGEREWVIEARFVDSIAIFESGYVAYSAAFIFGRNGGRAPHINAKALLALASIAQPAGGLCSMPFRLAFVSDDLEAPRDFLQDRLKKLNTQAVCGCRTAFSVFFKPAIRKPRTPSVTGC